MTTEPGLLLVDKPVDLTSHDVVRQARRALGEKRIGHTGTLDPFASGLLLLCIGSFTRATEYFHALPKTYRASMRLGRETDTDDPTGESLSESEDWRDLDPAEVDRAIRGLVGPGRQVPSRFSAKKVDGVRAYDAARAGRELELAAIDIVVHEAVPLEIRLPDVEFEVTVSTGTYVRALARDLGRAFGCGAHLTALRRTAIGPLDVADAVRPDDIPAPSGLGAPAWRPAARALPWLASRELGEGEVADIRHGRSIPADGISDGPVALVAAGRLVALAEVVGETIRPRKVFPA